MLTFLRMFLKFYLAGTPYRGNTRCFRGCSEQIQHYKFFIERRSFVGMPFFTLGGIYIHFTPIGVTKCEHFTTIMEVCSWQQCVDLLMNSISSSWSAAPAVFLIINDVPNTVSIPELFTTG